MPKGAIYEYIHHSKQVTVLEWCPGQEHLLASGSDDHTVNIWDQSLIGMEQARDDYEDGPPELLFPHMFHNSVIEDIQWCPTKGAHFNMALATVETNMQMQVWQMSKREFIEKESDNLHLADKIMQSELE